MLNPVFQQNSMDKLNSDQPGGRMGLGSSFKAETEGVKLKSNYNVLRNSFKEQKLV